MSCSFFFLLLNLFFMNVAAAGSKVEVSSKGGAADAAAGDAAVKAAAVVVTATASPGLVPGRWHSVGKGGTIGRRFCLFLPTHPSNILFVSVNSVMKVRAGE